MSSNDGRRGAGSRGAGSRGAGIDAGRPAVFLDRDGVINENLDGAYVRTWEAFRFLPGAVESIVALSQAGHPVVVVTNQGGIGRGHMTAAALDDIHARMVAAIRASGGLVDAVLYCPHHPDDGCECRKPRPGLLQRAACELGLDLSRSVFVGDHLTDLQAAVAAGCRPILVLTGRGRPAHE
ncbi:MAG: D-glycero-beta-D-manno-heptose 1,7-bisphosphate 7-phosphatase, partial [Chloroflexota bacterium]